VAAEPVQLSDDEIALVRREVAAASAALRGAKVATDPMGALAGITEAVEALTSTQHELVNVLLDRGCSWSDLAVALSTSRAGAKRRYPRRTARSAPG
jgi:hypothetical protein